MVDAYIQPFSTQVAGSVTSIDLATGVVTLNIPIRSKNGKFPVSYSLRGNSGVTLDANGNWTTLQYSLDAEMIKSSTQMPFLYGIANGLLGAEIASSVTPQECGPNQYGNRYDDFAVVDATGASHPFPIQGVGLYAGPNPNDGCGPLGPITLTATDGSGFTLVATGGLALSLTLYDKAGNNFTVSGTNGVSQAEPQAGPATTKSSLTAAANKRLLPQCKRPC